MTAVRRKGSVDGGLEEERGERVVSLKPREESQGLSQPTEAISQRKGVTHNVRPLNSSQGRLQKPGRVGERVGFRSNLRTVPLLYQDERQGPAQVQGAGFCVSCEAGDKIAWVRQSGVMLGVGVKEL